ncbi:MAG: hypothetical protein J6T96_03040, partial [Bacteroidales bacterium]|nr:hypothetical protein [Bacteroidales bacterium]
MKLKYLIILAVAILASAICAKAQVVDTSFYKAQRGHYVSLEAGYGAMSLLHGMSDDANTTDLRYGLQARFSYRWYIFRYWALGTGLHYQQMGTRSMVNNMQHIPNAKDERNRKIEHRTEFHNLDEKVDAHVFSIPAGIYLHGIQLMKRLKMNFGAGVMFNIPIKNSYKTTGGLDTRLYYDEYHLELANLDEKNNHNVYKINRPFSGRYDLVPSLSVFGEMGFIYSLNRRIDITLTALGAYGLSPTISGDKYLYDPDCMTANGYTNPKYNGVLASEEAYGVRCLNLGGMLGIRYHIGTYSISPDELERVRRTRNFDEIEFCRNRKLEFDLLDRQKRREVEDSLLDIIERHKRPDLQDEQRVRDSLARIAAADSIAKAQADSIAKAKADSIAKAKADSLSIALDTTHMEAVFNEVVRVELDSIILELNHNYCKFNESRLELTRHQKKCIDRLAFLMTNFPSINIICIGH